MTKINMTITRLNCYQNLPGANELMASVKVDHNYYALWDKHEGLICYF